MTKTVITSDKAPAAIGTYSQAIKAGNTVYMSGQIPLDPKTMELVEGFEVLAHDLVDLGEVAQVGEEDVQLDDVLERTASGFGHGLEVFEDLYGLCFEAFNQFHGFWVQGI